MKRKKLPSKKKKKKPRKKRPLPPDYSHIVICTSPKHNDYGATDDILYIVTKGIVDHTAHPGSHLHDEGVYIIADNHSGQQEGKPLKDFFSLISPKKNSFAQKDHSIIIPGNPDYPAVYFERNLSLGECEDILKGTHLFCRPHQSVLLNIHKIDKLLKENYQVKMADETLLPVTEKKWSWFIHHCLVI